MNIGGQFKDILQRVILIVIIFLVLGATAGLILNAMGGLQTPSHTLPNGTVVEYDNPLQFIFDPTGIGGMLFYAGVAILAIALLFGFGWSKSGRGRR